MSFITSSLLWRNAATSAWARNQSELKTSFLRHGTPLVLQGNQVGLAWPPQQEAWAKHGANRWNGTTKHETQFSIRKPHHADLLVQKSPAEAAPGRLNKAFSMFQLKCQDIPIQYSNNQNVSNIFKIFIDVNCGFSFEGITSQDPLACASCQDFFGIKSPMRLALKQHLAKA